MLRFEAKVVSTEPDDEIRSFIISFYCGDDTIQVYEVCDKNSGRIGGKFMERKKHKSPITKDYYQEKDFLIGRTIFLGGYKFQLLKADDYTEKYMEDNFDTFPEADLQAVLRKVKRSAAAFNSLQEYAIQLMKMIDPRGNGFVPIDDFFEGLQRLNIYLTSHEQHLVVRKFDVEKTGHLSMEDFYNQLAVSQ